MTDDDHKALGYTPAIHWITHEEVCVQQEVFAVRECRPSHPDPTADAAIGRIVCEARREKRRQQAQKKRHKKHRNKKKSNQPGVGVWRWDDEQKKDRQKKDRQPKGEGRKQDGRGKESNTNTETKKKSGRGEDREGIL